MHPKTNPIMLPVSDAGTIDGHGSLREQDLALNYSHHNPCRPCRAPLRLRLSIRFTFAFCHFRVVFAILEVLVSITDTGGMGPRVRIRPGTANNSQWLREGDYLAFEEVMADRECGVGLLFLTEAGRRHGAGRQIRLSARLMTR